MQGVICSQRVGQREAGRGMGSYTEDFEMEVNGLP